MRLCSEAVELRFGKICFKNKTDYGYECEKDYVKTDSFFVKISNKKDLIYPVSCVTINTSDLFLDKSKHSQFVDFIQTKELQATWFSVEVENFDEGFKHSVKPGLCNIQILNVKIINRLEAPFKSNCTTNNGEINVFGAPYTRRKCKATLMFKQMLEKCGDVPDNLKMYVRPHHKI